MVAGERGSQRRGTDDETRALRRIVAKAGPLLATEHVLAARAEGDVFRVVAGSGVAARLVGVAVPPGLGLLGTSVADPRAVTIPDYAQHAGAAPAVVDAKVRGLVVAPILVRGGLAGCVCAFRLRPDAFSPGEQRMLEELAAEAAATLEAAARQRDHFDRVEEISQALLGPYDIATVLDRVRALADRIAPAAGFSIALLDEAGARVQKTVRYGRPAPARGRRTRGEPMTYPIRFGDRALGALRVTTASAEEAEVLSDLARLLGTAVANAALVREFRDGSARTARLVAERDAVLEQIPSGVIVVDGSGRLTFINEAGRRIAGVPPDPSRPLADQIASYRPRDPDSGRPLPDDVAARTLTEGVEHVEVLFRPPGASEDRCVRASARPLRDGAGQVTGAVVVFSDVTAERRMLRDLAASEELRRATYDAMACGVIVRDASGAIVRTNAAVERILGLSAERLREGGDLSFLKRTMEDGTELPIESYPWRVALRTREPVRGRILQVTRPDGERRWLHLDVVPVLDARGAVVEVVSSFIDITGRKRAEEEIEARARQQEAIVELGQASATAMRFAGLMERAAALVARMLDCEFVKILELLPEGGLALRAGVGWRHGAVGDLVIAAERSQGGYALRSGAPVVVEDLATEPRFPRPALLGDHGVTSGLSVVIDTKDGPFGTLGAHTARRRSFGASEVAFLQVVAAVLGGVAQRERRRAQRTVLLGRLTPREREVLRLAAQGLNNRDVAARLGIGYATVRRHVRGFIEKLDTRSKLEAVARARTYGLLNDDQVP